MLTFDRGWGPLAAGPDAATGKPKKRGLGDSMQAKTLSGGLRVAGRRGGFHATATPNYYRHVHGYGVAHWWWGGMTR